MPSYLTNYNLKGTHSDLYEIFLEKALGRLEGSDDYWGTYPMPPCMAKLNYVESRSLDGGKQQMAKWVFRTHAGQAQIFPTRRGFALVFDDKTLGLYASPAAAAKDLTNGRCAWPFAGDPSKMGIPEKIGEWQWVP
ncbi:hypothetical protein NLM33_35165 [Bradyrhizobium sp. CCGUVB1N3]|uniref:hypothetical protein n=1 Tax=Bradyrhizobium sp. CCGUVB1N3 TaxID=2949629 RepID=UPI0020B3B91F|nr:hypothetical protein [Bradyrhizobium sp. CCGUVB1N3]MCP3475531.1 hypothetical protein [Bradyrhizobium sp. CCGUVB1N3]